MTARLLTLTACIALAGAMIGHASAGAERVPPRADFGGFPLAVDTWQGQPTQPFDADILKILAVDDYINRVYVRAGTAVGLYIGYYRSQREGDTMHSPLNCLPGAGWEPIEKTRETIDVQPYGPVQVNRLTIQKGLDRQVVVYWYQSHGRVIASEYWGRAYMALDAVRLNRTDGAMVRVVSPIDDRRPNGRAEAAARADEFVKAVFPLLPRYLPD
jgi:EpsI family protein